MPMRASSPASESPFRLKKEGFARLSTRETEVLSYASWGYLDKQICAKMLVSPNTLRTYWARIRSKIGDGPRSALAVAYVENATVAEPEPPTPYDWEYDFTTGLVQKLTNKRSLYGVAPGEYIPFAIVMGMVHPDDADRVRSIFELLIRGEVSSLCYAYRVVTDQGIQIASSQAEPVRNERGEVVKLRGRRLQNTDLREPAVSTIQIGHWERDLDTDEFSADSGFCSIFKIDPGSSSLREDAMRRFPESEKLNIETFVQRTIEAGQTENRSTHQLQFPNGSTIWATTHLRIEYENGAPRRALGTVIAFA